MDKTTDLLLTITRSVIEDRLADIPPPDEATLSALYALAKRHEMAHLAAEGLRRADLLPAGELGAKFRKQRMAAIYSDESKAAALADIDRHLTAAAIPYIPLKGAVLRDLYPATWMRTRCDIDILIRPEALDAAIRALTDAGYDLHHRTDHDVHFYSPRKVHIELHFRLIPDYSQVTIPDMDTLWAGTVPVSPHTCRYALEDALFYEYHVVHMVNHILSGGCGLRPFLDLWLLDNLPTADHPARKALIAQSDLTTFAEVASQLAASLFGTTPCTDPTCLELADYVTSTGVYGDIRKEAANWQAPPVQTLCQKVFWPYHLMAIRYPQLERHRWLYPLYHIRRWWDMCRSGEAGTKLKKWRRQRSLYHENHEAIRALYDKLGL